MSKFALFRKNDRERVEKKVDEFINSLPPIKKRRLTRNLIKFVKIFFIFSLVFIVILVLFFAYNYFVFKNVYYEGSSAKNNIKSSIYFIKQHDFDKAHDYALKAQENFSLINNNIDQIKNDYFLSNFRGVKNQLDDLEHLTTTGEILSNLIVQGTMMGTDLNEIMNNRFDFSFSEFSEEERRNILQFLFESGPEIYGIKANIDLAVLNLDQFQGSGFFRLLYGQVNDFKEQLSYGSYLLAKIVPLTEILPYMAGYPSQSNFLVMFQNNDEIRPTGGFLGSYGVMQTYSGEIVNFDTHDIYHMDMPVSDKLNIEPPKPIKDHMIDKWYMRDANWSPDWPTSAKKIEWFYDQEYDLLPDKNKADQFGGDFQGVIGITPKFVSSLLDIIGSVNIEGEEYNSDNFHDILQYRVERKYQEQGVSDWERKNVIGDILKIVKTRILDLPASKWNEVFNVTEKSFANKDILLYLNDERLQDYIKFLNWNGEVIQSDSDYLMVIDANLGSFKTDAVVNKKIEYSLNVNGNSLTGEVSLNYAHQGGFDWRTTRYRSYTRVYVPKGAKLVEIKGDYQGEVDVIDELGKTYFGFFISVEPGEIDNIQIKYTLPKQLVEKIQNEKNYSIYIQKQPGRVTQELLVDLKLDNKVKSYKPTGFNVENNNNKNIIWKTDLEVDRVFNLTF